MTIKELIKKVDSYVTECGMSNSASSSKGNTIFRNNATVKDGKLPDSAYFGFIRENENTTGPYQDYSLVFFPAIGDSEEVKTCIPALCVGSLGFAHDYDLAHQPWIRRLFSKLRKPGDRTYFKHDFSDIESTFFALKSAVVSSEHLLSKTIEKYIKVISAAQILNFSEKDIEENLTVIYAWIATYADLRGWATNDSQRKAIRQYLPAKKDGSLTTESISTIVERDKYVILQGAPGTGKTFTASKIAEQYDKVFFEQFHAETTFSDFVYGIVPNLRVDSLTYEAKKGILYQAIEAAKNGSDKRVLLIIDEINRANLPNVLGPVFYLFEKHPSKCCLPIVIGDMKLDTLPENLHVIATMNTSDRSLAVVDFALRRRFTWLTLRAQEIEDERVPFHKDEFNRFAEFFQKYATDEELNLQPGQSYFIAKDEEVMKERLRYELMPLMKEYFSEGYLLSAKDDVTNYFYEKLGIMMYE